MRALSTIVRPLILWGVILTGVLIGGCDDSSDTTESTIESESEDNVEESADSPEEENTSQTPTTESTPPEIKLEIEVSEKESTSEGLHWDVEETENGEFWINVNAVELKDVYGIAFHLTFDPSVVTYLEGLSTDILRDNQAEVASLFRPDDGVVRFGTVRLHEPLGGGQGLVYTGIEVPKGVIAKFKFAPLTAGSSDIEISQEGLDLRNADLDPMKITVTGQAVNIVEEEILP
jgi:hypothetical protein